MEQKIETNQGVFLIRPFEEGDEEGVLSLWRAAFGREFPRDVWRWKYMDNPFGRLFMLCVTEDGLPVAAYASLPYRARWNGRDVLLAHPVDSMSHPEYRGSVGGRKGLFVRTVHRFLDVYAGPDAAVFVYGFPGERHFKLGRMMLGYDRLPRGILYLRTSTGDLRPVRRKYEQAAPIRDLVVEQEPEGRHGEGRLQAGGDDAPRAASRGCVRHLIYLIGEPRSSRRPHTRSPGLHSSGTEARVRNPRMRSRPLSRDSQASADAPRAPAARSRSTRGPGAPLHTGLPPRPARGGMSGRQA